MELHADDGGAVGTGISVVKVTGRATIHDAQELRTALVSAMGAGRDVMLDVRDVTEHDLSFLQIILSAYRSACAEGRRFHLGGTCPETLRASFAVAGITLMPDLAG